MIGQAQMGGMRGRTWGFNNQTIKPESWGSWFNNQQKCGIVTKGHPLSFIFNNVMATRNGVPRHCLILILARETVVASWSLPLLERLMIDMHRRHGFVQR